MSKGSALRFIRLLRKYRDMQMKKIRWLVLCILALCLFIPAGIAERAIPEVLKVTQEVKCYRAKGYRIITYSELHSTREDVNDLINGRVAALKEETEAVVPEVRE